MKIYVTAKPKKKEEYVKRISPTDYVVAVKEPAEKGRANRAIVQALADYFGVSAGEVVLVSGQTAKFKTFNIPDLLVNFEPNLSQKKLF